MVRHIDVLGQRFNGERTEAAWQRVNAGLAQSGEDITVQQAVIRAGLNRAYADAPLGFELPDGTFVRSGRRKVLLQEDGEGGWNEVGVVSDDYRYLQNMELAAGLDAVRKATGWKFENLGELNGGRTTFMSLQIGEREVLGDKYMSYLHVGDGKASGRALSVFVSATRLICANAILSAQAAADVVVKIPHAGDVAGEFNFWLKYVPQMRAAQEQLFTKLEAMARVKIGEGDARSIIDSAYPLPTKSARVRMAEEISAMPKLEAAAVQELGDRVADDAWMHDYLMGYTQKRRETAFELYQRFNAGEEHGVKALGRKLSAKSVKELRDTPYAAIQAVSELADWGGQTRVAAGAGTLFGEPAKIKRAAWEAASRFVES